MLLVAYEVLLDQRAGREAGNVRKIPAYRLRAVSEVPFEVSLGPGVVESLEGAIQLPEELAKTPEQFGRVWLQLSDQHSG